MSENKYKVLYDDVSGNYLVLDDDDIICHFCEEKDAQEYCDWKNQNHIQPIVKDFIIKKLEKLVEEKHSHAIEIKEAIEIIKSLKDSE